MAVPRAAPPPPPAAATRIVRVTRGLPQPSPMVRGRLVAADGEHAAVWRVPEEVPLAVLLNGDSFAVMMATPSDLEDFALGFALTEGIVAAVGEIESLRIAEASDGFLLNLVIDPARAAAVAERRRGVPGRSGCGICGAQTIGAALPRLPRVSGTAPSVAALRTAYAALPTVQQMNAENRSTHAAAWCGPDGSIRLLREDIGRHNALDKLAGAMARAGLLPATDGFLLLSSRVSVEMVQKAAMIGIPFVAAVSAPTALALRQAADAGIGLAGSAGDGIMLFDTASIGDRSA